MNTHSGVISTENPVSIFRQRGFTAGRYERAVEIGRATATAAGEDELAAFEAGLRIGRRERERARTVTG